MWWPFQWLVIYVLGGVTFVPLLVAAIIFYALTYGSTPLGDSDPAKLKKASLQHRADLDEETKREKATEGATDGKDSDAAQGTSLTSGPAPNATVSGWLTVRRQFKPSKELSSFLIAKPTTDLSGAEVVDKDGEDEKAESQFKDKDEKEAVTEGGSKTSNGSSSQPKTYSSRIAQTYRQMMEARQARKESPPKEYFFCVLKGSVLFLYEDEEQSDCVAAIGVDKYEIGVENSEGGKYRGKDAEMFAKRNALVMRMVNPEADAGSNGSTGSGSAEKKKGLPVLAKGMAEVDDKEEAQEMENAPWFFFSKSNTKMEDWYLALLQCSAQHPTLDGVFSISDMQSLVNTIDSEPDPIPMRWFNAMFGRVFLGVNRTAALEQLIIRQIMKKLSKVPRPNFLSPIIVREVNVGRDPPYFSKPMLKELTADGDASFEVQMHYHSRPNVPDSVVRITIGTTATIPTGFKPYVVDLVLAVELKSLEGNVVMKIKKPPSNRVWWGFTNMPKMDIEIIPVVSERKIQIGMVLKAIEKQLRDVIAESVVHPNLDDIAFFDTSALDIRGGVFMEAGKNTQKAQNPATVSNEGVGPVQPGLDVGTSNEDPSSATAQTAKKRRPTKSQTIDSNGAVTITSDDSHPSVNRTSSDGHETSGLPRTETSPAAFASTSPQKKAAAVSTTKKWFASNKSSDSLGLTQRRWSRSDEAGSPPHPLVRGSLDEMAEGSAADTVSINDDSSSLLAAPAEVRSRPRSVEPSTETDRDSTQFDDDSTSTLNLATDDKGDDRSPSRSSTSLLSAVRNRDKKVLTSQVNLAKDNLKKWGVNWAAKRRAASHGKHDDSFDGVDEDAPAAYYGPGAGDELGHAAAMSKRVSSEAGREGAGRSLQERLNAAAQASGQGNHPLDRQRSGSSTTSHTESTPASILPTILTSSSKGSTSSTPGASGHRDTPQFNLAAPRPITEVARNDVAASSLSATSSAPATVERDRRAMSVSSTTSSGAGSTGNYSQPVQSQPAGARSMVVPRIPKRPGAVTGIGSNSGSGEPSMARSAASDTAVDASVSNTGASLGKRKEEVDAAQLHEVGSGQTTAPVLPKRPPPSLPPRPAAAKEEAGSELPPALPSKDTVSTDTTDNTEATLSHPLEQRSEASAGGTDPFAPAASETAQPASKPTMETTSSAQAPETAATNAQEAAQSLTQGNAEVGQEVAVQASVAEDSLRKVAEKNEAALKAKDVEEEES